MKTGRAALGLSLVVLLGTDAPWTDASSGDLHAHARAVSLDIRGVVPTAEELTAIERAGELDDTTLDAWLASDAFVEIAVERHRERFWNQLELTLLNNRRIARRSGTYFLPPRARFLRGAPQVHCGTHEAETDESNRPLTWVDNGDGTISEGWVWVTPYWDPSTQVQVCAFDAQTVPVSPSGTDCSTEAAHRDAGCGCGPGLIWCMTPAVELEIEAALAADIDERIRTLLATDAPYSSLLTSSDLYVNGASTHFFRHLAPFRTRDYDSPVPVEDLPDIDFSSTEMVPVPLGDHHAGALTAPGWLLRHQTNRGRANRFYGGFLCKEFLPTSGGDDAAISTDLPTPDLQVRDGCLDCHARLEPWAAYWGRWAEAGSRHLSAETHPSYNAECAICDNSGNACPDICDDHYITEASHEDEESFIGTFSTYAFLFDEDASHPDEGPGAWVDRAVADGSLAACAVDSASGWLLADTPTDADAEAWAAAFSGDESYRSLVRRVITSESYWRGAP